MHPKRQVYTGEKVDMGGVLSKLLGHEREIVLPAIIALLLALTLMLHFLKEEPHE